MQNIRAKVLKPRFNLVCGGVHLGVQCQVKKKGGGGSFSSTQIRISTRTNGMIDKWCSACGYVFHEACKVSHPCDPSSFGHVGSYTMDQLNDMGEAIVEWNEDHPRPKRARKNPSSSSKVDASEDARRATAPAPLIPPPKQREERKVGVSQAQDGKAKGLVDTNPPRGTRDFLPEDMRLRNWLFGEFCSISERFGFEQFDVPVLESEELFIRKAGEEITDQLYNFEDKGSRRMTLRPEITPSLARLVLGKGKALPLPLKWFTVGQCWRYERMTRGRRREHYQWNMDIVGVTGVEAEAELLAALTQFFSKVGLTAADVGIRVSSRKVLQAVLDRFAVPPASFAAVCVIVDKIEKIPREKVVEELSALGVAEEAVNGILAAMQIRTLQDLESLLGSDSSAVADLQQLFSLAAGYGYQDWLVLDASVVRGLAYYTGVVFEGFDRAGNLRAICGGGRYDKLLGTFGGADLPCAGFGFGDAVIVELLKDKGLLPSTPHQVDDVVLPMDEGLRAAACGIATKLREAGRKVDLVLEPKRMKWAFKHSQRINAKRLVLVGQDEWARGAVTVKDLAKFDQNELPIDQLLDDIPGSKLSSDQ